MTRYSAACILALLACSVSSAQEKSAPKGDKTIPAGSERAVKAALAACPGGVLEEVVTPGRPLGLGGADDLMWTLHVRADGTRRTLIVAANGVLVRASKTVEPKDLPTMVGSGLAKAAPNGAAKITKLETLGVPRYVRLAAPEIRYSARVSGKSETVNVTVAPDGTVLESKRVQEAKKAPAVASDARIEDGPIPEQAAKAVLAMRDVFPNMVFDLVEEVPYIDSSTQTIEMMWYEVEFFVDGVKHEFNATPDGIVIAYKKTLSVADLPKPVADALAKAVPGGRIEEIVKSETRAGPTFVGLDNPIVVYEIQPRGETGAAAAGIKLRVDGTVVKEPELPDWAKKPSGKEEKEEKEEKGKKDDDDDDDD